MNDLLIDVDTERALVSAAIQDPKYFTSLDVAPEAFALGQMSHIWATGQKLMAAGTYPDQYMLLREFERQGQEGMASKLAELAADERAFAPNAPAYARIVLDLATRRRKKAAYDLAYTPLLKGQPYEAQEAALREFLSGNGHTPQRTRPFQPIPAGELHKLPPIEYLDEFQELPKGRVVAAYGPSGVGKSFWALDRALRIAQHHPVVYVAAEGAEGYAARVLAWCQHFHMEPGQLYFIGEAANMMAPAEVRALIDSITPIGPALVVIDTLARCLVGGDENTARDMGLFVAGCDDVKVATGATVLIVHHSGKNGASERGSSALRAACDQMLEFADKDDLIALTCAKSKDSRGFPNRAYRRVVIETGRQLPDGQPETSCVILSSAEVVMAGTLTPAGRKILEALKLEAFVHAGAKSAQLISHTKLGDSTFYNAVSRLIREGMVRQAERGEPYYITLPGHQALGNSPVTTNGL